MPQHVGNHKVLFKWWFYYAVVPKGILKADVVAFVAVIEERDEWINSTMLCFSRLGLGVSSYTDFHQAWVSLFLLDS